MAGDSMTRQTRGRPDDLMVSVLMAICGTDREILEGDLGYPPSGRDRLILGHEALGR